MKHKKIASILAIALLWIGASLFPVPSVQAFHTGSVQWETTGTVVQGYFDDYLGSINSAGREGQSVNINARIIATSATGQRNLTLGVKFDWMTSWVNSSVVAVQPDRLAVITTGVPMPALSGANAGLNLVTHTWEARIWNTDGVAKVTTNNCTDGGTPPCVSSGTQTGFAIYSNDQTDGVQAKLDAEAKVATLSGTLFALQQLPPGGSKAAADLSGASAELTLGDTSYEAGNFAVAKTHYQNALNLANSAAAALGGGESGSYFGSWFSGVGWLLGGVAALLLGFGGFRYLNKRKA